MVQCIKKSVLINSSSWMGDPEMNIEIITDWKVGGPFIIKGFHHLQFENKGTILQFEQEKIFRYSYLSSLSNLADIPENHTTISFNLVPKGGMTELTVEVANFPTEAIYKHLEFYWNGTIKIIKLKIEKK